MNLFWIWYVTYVNYQDYFFLFLLEYLCTQGLIRYFIWVLMKYKFALFCHKTKLKEQVDFAVGDLKITRKRLKIVTLGINKFCVKLYFISSSSYIKLLMKFCTVNANQKTNSNLTFYVQLSTFWIILSWNWKNYVYSFEQEWNNKSTLSRVHKKKFFLEKVNFLKCTAHKEVWIVNDWQLQCDIYISIQENGKTFGLMIAFSPVLPWW